MLGLALVDIIIVISSRLHPLTFNGNECKRIRSSSRLYRTCHYVIAYIIKPARSSLYAVLPFKFWVRSALYESSSNGILSNLSSHRCTNWTTLSSCVL